MPVLMSPAPRSPPGRPSGAAFPRRSFLAPQSRRRRAPPARSWGLPSGGGDLLAIDRDCEYRNSVTAAAAGAGAPVIEYRPQDGLLVIGYIEGRTFGPADVARNIPRIAQACRRLHAGGRFGNDFDMFDI